MTLTGFLFKRAYELQAISDS